LNLLDNSSGGKQIERKKFKPPVQLFGIGGFLFGAGFGNLFRW
jgi:hypothetical protein